tara:strand:+ start:218 stop:742 length:525 start_codon:yes stop_codon:yes gene_type:complete
MPFFGLVRPKCDHCGYRCGYMLHQGWRHADYPGYVFGKKKCLVAYVRRNPKIKQKLERTTKIPTNYPTVGSQGKYSNIWRNALPTISEILGSSAPSGSITLNFEDFVLVGNRQSYSFNLEFCDGNVSNNISGSAVARDLAAVLRSSSKIKSAIQDGVFKFRMDKNFTLWVSRIG